MLGYLFLVLTVLCEVCGTTMMKLSEGFSKPVPSILAGVSYLGTLGFMTLALKYLNLSLVYAVWSGLGLTLVTILGIFIFKETVTWQKILFLSLILIGVVGLNVMKKPADESGPQLQREVSAGTQILHEDGSGL